MSEQSTVMANVKLDIGPEGIKFTIEGLDSDLARLIQSASKFTVKPIEYNTFDTSNVIIQSDKVLTFVDPTA